MRRTAREIILIFLSIPLFLFSFGRAYASGIAADPVISRNIPAYTSDDCSGSYPASRANNSLYNDYWRSCNASPSAQTPVTLTYDLSGVSAASRKNVIVAWYNDPVTGAYDHTLINVNSYNMPGDYTIQANAAAGGSVPSNGWVTLVTVTNNVYHSRQHKIDLTGYNWLRLSVTRSEGSILNYDVALNMDIHDVSGGVTDDWIFFGDSITQQAFLHENNYGGTFSQAINTFNSTYFPIYESGGIGGFTAADGANNINTWLPLFLGKFVALNYGTNDANGLVSGTTFYNNMKTMIQAIINAGKVPVIPKIPWGCTTNITSDVGTLNSEIDQLYIDFPQIIKGPDLYTFFNGHQGDISNDCIHPTDPAGYTDYFTQWTNSMETAVYTLPVVSASPTGSTFSTSQSVTLSSTKTGTIYYTLDGTDPTTSSASYSAALTINSTTTLKVMTVDQAGNQSSTITENYVFPTSTPSPTPSPTPVPTSSSSSSSGPAANPNIHTGWSKEVTSGPHFIGSEQFIHTFNSPEDAMAFISSNAVRDDVNVTIAQTPLTAILSEITGIPFPWMQHLNIAGEIYHYTVVSAFNGYPIQRFDKPVTIIIPYDPLQIAWLSPKVLKIIYYDSSSKRWKILPTPVVVNTHDHTLATTTWFFSYFSVGYTTQSL